MSNWKLLVCCNARIHATVGCSIQNKPAVKTMNMKKIFSIILITVVLCFGAIVITVIYSIKLLNKIF